MQGRRKGSGHHLTFELSPGGNVDLTNQKRWLRMMSGKRFFSRLSMSPVTRHGESLCCTALPASVWQKSRRATSRWLWSYVWYRSWSLITTHNYIPWGQLECRNVPRPFPPPPHKGSGSETIYNLCVLWRGNHYCLCPWFKCVWQYAISCCVYM